MNQEIDLSIYVRKLTLKQSKKDIFFEIVRFLLVGGLATICDYLVFYLFNVHILKYIDIKINTIISTTLGFITGLLVNWFLSTFVYKNINKDLLSKKIVFIKYIILCLFGYLLTLLVMTLTTPIHNNLIITIFNIDIAVYKWLFKILMTLIVLIINYLGRKFFVFKDKSLD
jgi:putative flippase GtrA